MKIRTITLTILAGAQLLTANASPVTAASHAFDPSASDVNKYNLDMSQDNISPGNFMYCRWGTLCDQQLAMGSPFSLQFDYLTPAPASQSSRDLLILASDTADDQFQLSAFQNQWPLPSSSSSWTTPLGPGFSIFGDPISMQPGQVQPDSPQFASTYFLFRKHEFSPVLFEWQGPNLQPRLDPNASKLVIMIHGWNRSQNYDNYQQDADFVNLGTAIHNQINGTDWKLVGYHWEADADTGSAVFGSRPNWGVLNGAEAAEAGYLHGLHLGQVLLNNYTNVQKVHLIAHSAGAWCARTAAKYLMQRNPEIKVEVTLLDPYVPGAVSPYDLDPIDLPSTSLTDDRINDLLNFGSSAYQLENYYSDDGFAIAGTQETFWGGGGVDWSMAINEQVGTSVLLVTTDRYGGHSGPIQFYSDTVNNTLASPPTPSSRLASFGSDLQKIGWWRSMFLDEPIIDLEPISVTDATQGQPVSFTAHATTRREQRGYPAPGLNLEYSWQKYDDATATWQTAYGSSLGATYSLNSTIASYAGQYRVIAENRAGGAISQIFTLSFDTGSGSPQISLLSPVSGATVSGTVAVTTTVSGAVGKVKFYLDGVSVATNTSAPFSWSWNSTQKLDGLHTLTANAYDSILGTLLGVSAPVTVTVSNGTAITGNLDIYEPNDSSTQATQLGFGTNIQAYISSPSDVDWFKVSVTNLGTLQLNLAVPSGKDFDLELYGPNGTWLAGSYQPAGFSESIHQPVTTLGTYYFRVYGYPLGAGSFSPSSAYSLSTSFMPQTATNIVSGGVTNVTWSGVVQLTGDVTINGGSVLTILPGTTILCKANTDTQAGGANSSRVEIILNGGTLRASGTAGSPVLFTSDAATKTPGDWYGIRVVQGDVTMSNCVVEFATEGVRFESADTRFNTYALGNVTVQRCSGDGVWTTSGQYAQPVVLNNFQLLYNQTGVNATGPVTLIGGLVRNNTGYGIIASYATLVATGTTVSLNGGYGIYNYGNNSGYHTTLAGCVVTYNQGDGVYVQSSTLQMSGCTLSRNNGWGLNGNFGNQGTWSAEVWNNVVQSNASGGLTFNYYVTVGLVSNTISGNGGNGVNLQMYNNYGNIGVSASGITGNVIYNNGGVGVDVQGNAPAVLTLAGNDIYQNTNFELRNDGSSAVVANANYWGNATSAELSQGKANLTRIYDIRDGAQQEALITTWYAEPLSSGNPGPLQTFTYAVPGVTQVVSGNVDLSQTWSGTVLVVGDVTVTGNLTIMPGTTVMFDALHDTLTAGNDRSRSELILNGGSLNIAGTAGSPVLFTSDAATKTPGDWYGIRVVQGDVTMSNCVVEFATEGVRFESADTRFNTYALGNVTVQRCSGDGVWTTSGQYAQPVVLNNFQLLYNQTGVNATGPVTLIGGLVRNNTGYGIIASYATLVATGTTVSLNGGYGIYNYGNNSGYHTTLAGCVVTYNQGDGVYVQSSTLQMSGCTLSRNNGWGLNGNFGNQGTWSAEVWNNVVQSNASGGLTFNYYVTVGLVSNTISGNGGNGVNLQMYNNYGNIGVSASGITGNVIYNNGGVGVDVQGNAPAVLTLAGNDIYQNTTYDLRNDSGNTVIATNEYWGEPTTSEVTANQDNLSRIYDSHDNASVGQVLVVSIRGAAAQNTLHFTQQPQSVVANIGDTVILSPLVAGTGPISFQWFDNGLPMAQATNLFLMLVNVNVGNSGGYYLVISNATGVVSSSVAFVAVVLPPGAPSVNQQPQSQSVLAGASVSFTVVAGGTGPFGYQWKKNNVAINGATSPTYTIHAVVVNDTGAYSVIVTNSGGSVSSQAATLTVNVLSGSAVNRTISTNGVNFGVLVVVDPPAGTPAYMVEEVLPTGFTPSNISSSGSWDAPSRTITWGPFWDGLPRSFTYTLLPPSGFSGTAALTGQALLFGATATTGGDSTVSIGPPPMSPVLALVKIAPGFYGVSVTGEIGRTYRIDAADNLGSGTWTPLITVLVTQSPFTIADFDSVNKTNRFYRITVIQ